MPLDLANLSDRVILLDGGWSTVLWQRDVAFGSVAELANLQQPAAVTALASEYVAAGAQVLCTNTFAANEAALAARGVSADVGELNAAGVRLARAVAEGQDIAIAGAIGPSGRIVTLGEITEQKLAASFADQAEALAGAGVDLFVLETFSELNEALVALTAIKAVCKLPIVASLSYNAGPQRTQTIMGNEAAACAEALDEAGADAIGFNCGSGPAEALPAVVALRAHTRKPIWVKPNAGLPDLEDGRPVYHTPIEEFASQMARLIEAGANLVGGCCGVGPEHIKRLAPLVKKRRG